MHALQKLLVVGEQNPQASLLEKDVFDPILSGTNNASYKMPILLRNLLRLFHGLPQASHFHFLIVLIGASRVQCTCNHASVGGKHKHVANEVVVFPFVVRHFLNNGISLLLYIKFQSVGYCVKIFERRVYCCK